MAIRGVFFDLYGTLLVYGDMAQGWGDWLDGLGTWLGERGMEIRRTRLAEACDGFFGRPQPERLSPAMTVYECRLERLCQDLGLAVEPRDLRHVADLTVAAWQRSISLDPHAIPVLRHLAGSVELALVSNFDHPRHVRRVLCETGLESFFDPVVVSAAVGCAKPDPAIFEVALGKGALRPAEVVYVGDADEDVLGAKAAGMIPVRLVRKGSGPTADGRDFRRCRDESDHERDGEQSFVIQDLAELRNLLGRL